MAGDNRLIETPWSGPLLPLHDKNVVRWACDAEHRALLCLILNDDWPPGFPAVLLVQVFVRKGDLAMLNQILKGFSDATLRKNGCDILHAAAQHGHADIVDMLLALGSRFTDVEWYSWETVFAAAERGHALVVEKLVAVRETYKTRYSFEAGTELVRSLLVATINGHLGVVETLLDTGIDISGERDILEDAVRAGKLGIFRELVIARAKLNGSELLVAETEGQVAIFEEILELRPRSKWSDN